MKFPSALESMSAEPLKETFQNTVTGGSMREPWDGRTPLVTDERWLLLDKMKPDDLDRHSKDLHLNDDASTWIPLASSLQGPKLDGKICLPCLVEERPTASRLPCRIQNDQTL